MFCKHVLTHFCMSQNQDFANEYVPWTWVFLGTGHPKNQSRCLWRNNVGCYPTFTHLEQHVLLYIYIYIYMQNINQTICKTTYGTTPMPKQCFVTWYWTSSISDYGSNEWDYDIENSNSIVAMLAKMETSLAQDYTIIELPTPIALRNFASKKCDECIHWVLS